LKSGHRRQAHRYRIKKLLLDQVSERPLVIANDSNENYRASCTASRKSVTTWSLIPSFGWLTISLGQLYIAEGKYPEALAELDLAVQYSHGNSDATSARAYVWALNGGKAKAQQTLEELKQEATQRYIPPWSIAVILYGLGDLDQTFAWLEKGCEERDPHITFIADDPKWDAVRSDPRFLKVLDRLQPKKA
jgi:tetratricopeptide (TPR) repeat protein